MQLNTSAYSNLATGLDSLAQALSGSTGSDASTASLTDLRKAFQTMVSDLGGPSNGAGSSVPANGANNPSTSLQSFLQHLAQNLQGSGSASLEALGNNVNKVV